MRSNSQVVALFLFCFVFFTCQDESNKNPSLGTKTYFEKSENEHESGKVAFKKAIALDVPANIKSVNKLPKSWVRVKLLGGKVSLAIPKAKYHRKQDKKSNETINGKVFKVHYSAFFNDKLWVSVKSHTPAATKAVASQISIQPPGMLTKRSKFKIGGKNYHYNVRQSIVDESQIAFTIIYEKAAKTYTLNATGHFKEADPFFYHRILFSLKEP